MPYCAKMPDGSYEWVFTKADLERMGFGPEALRKMIDTLKESPTDPPR